MCFPSQFGGFLFVLFFINTPHPTMCSALQQPPHLNFVQRMDFFFSSRKQETSGQSEETAARLLLHLLMEVGVNPLHWKQQHLRPPASF